MLGLGLSEIGFRFAIGAVVLVIFGLCLRLALRVSAGPVRHGTDAAPAGGAAILGLLACAVQGAGWVRAESLTADLPRTRGAACLSVLAALCLMAGLALGAGALRPAVAAHWPARSATLVVHSLETARWIGLRTAALNLLPLPPLAMGLLLFRSHPKAFGRMAGHAGGSAAALLVVFVSLRILGDGDLFAAWPVAR